jgi:hypothetical protein
MMDDLRRSIKKRRETLSATFSYDVYERIKDFSDYSGIKVSLILSDIIEANLDRYIRAVKEVLDEKEKVTN